MSFFGKVNIIKIPSMSEKEFLAVLTAIVINRRLNPLKKLGCAPMTFAFVRIGHWDGGPALIRTNDGEHGNRNNPICEACRFLTGKIFAPEQWHDAADKIGLPPLLARAINDACELSRHRDPALYRRILLACNLPHANGNEDEEDIEYYKNSSKARGIKIE